MPRGMFQFEAIDQPGVKGKFLARPTVQNAAPGMMWERGEGQQLTTEQAPCPTRMGTASAPPGMHDRLCTPTDTRGHRLCTPGPCGDRLCTQTRMTAGSVPPDTLLSLCCSGGLLQQGLPHGPSAQEQDGGAGDSRGSRRRQSLSPQCQAHNSILSGPTNKRPARLWRRHCPLLMVTGRWPPAQEVGSCHLHGYLQLCGLPPSPFGTENQTPGRGAGGAGCGCAATEPFGNSGLLQTWVSESRT